RTASRARTSCSGAEPSGRARRRDHAQRSRLERDVEVAVRPRVAVDLRARRAADRDAPSGRERSVGEARRRAAAEGPRDTEEPRRDRLAQREHVEEPVVAARRRAGVEAPGVAPAVEDRDVARRDGGRVVERDLDWWLALAAAGERREEPVGAA